MLALADLLEDAEHHGGHDEGDVDDRRPVELRLLVVLPVEEDLQQVDRRDRDDGRGDLDLQAARVELAQSGGVVIVDHIETANEILVARDHHHHDQACDECRVDQAEHGENHPGFVEGEEVRGDLGQLVEKRDGVKAKGDCEADIEDDQQPAGGKNDPLNQKFQRFHAIDSWGADGGTAPAHDSKRTVHLREHEQR